MDDEGMQRAGCPICGMEKINDAGLMESCTLCGMGIYEPALTPALNLGDGRALRFCCRTCLHLYKRKMDPHGALRIPETTAVLTCPHCGASYDVEMPVGIRMLELPCKECGNIIRPRNGDCCAFCSWADTGCPTSQAIERGGWSPSSPVARGP